MSAIDPGRFDHAVLDPAATAADVRQAARRCVASSVRGLCVAPSRLAEARRALGEGGPCLLVVVAGFPGAHATPEAIRREAEQAAEAGADEIDLVLPTGRIREGDLEAVARETARTVAAVAPLPVKAIVEVSVLDDPVVREAIERIVSPSGAAFLKTGTGVYGSPLEVHRIRCIAGMLPAGMRLKVAGGIRDRRAAAAAIAAGAEVLGTSRTFAILESVGSS